MVSPGRRCGQISPTAGDAAAGKLPIYGSDQHRNPDEARGADMAEYTKHQQNIIRNYYQNQDTIALQKLGEMVTDLYLAEGKARERQWKRIVGALEKLKVPASRIEHLQKQDDPALVAKLLEELLAKK
jgi:hypothetical protein